MKECEWCFNETTIARGMDDTPRLLGYFYDEGNNNLENVYKLFGWAKYNGNSNGNFYYTLSDDTKNIKYPLDDNNSNLKRIDDIPDKIKITKGPIRGEFKF
jgi:hypothetical protein